MATYNWMDQVIINTLNGQSQAAIKNLSDKQQAVFLKYFTTSNSSHHSYCYEYISKDKRYYAHIGKVCNKYIMTCKDYTLLEIERINKAIALIKKELETGYNCKYDISYETKEEYIKVKKTLLDNEEIEENKEDLQKLKEELKHYTNLLN